MIRAGVKADGNIRHAIRHLTRRLQRSLHRDISSRPRDSLANADQIAGIKESCKINIAVLDYIQEHIHEGMNTAEIDKIVYDMTTSMGGIPAPLHYQGYPYSVCTSVNDQVCHGFPSKEVILKAEILSMWMFPRF